MLHDLWTFMKAVAAETKASLAGAVGVLILLVGQLWQTFSGPLPTWLGSCLIVLGFVWGSYSAWRREHSRLTTFLDPPVWFEVHGIPDRANVRGRDMLFIPDVKFGNRHDQKTVSIDLELFAVVQGDGLIYCPNESRPVEEFETNNHYRTAHLSLPVNLPPGHMVHGYIACCADNIQSEPGRLTCRLEFKEHSSGKIVWEEELSFPPRDTRPPITVI